jgi:hypothetical protein
MARMVGERIAQSDAPVRVNEETRCSGPECRRKYDRQVVDDTTTIVRPAADDPDPNTLAR